MDKKSFLGSLLVSLYRTDNITRGNIEKYWKKLHKEEHTLKEVIDYIEADKHTKLDLSKLVLVSHKDGKYAPMFAGFIEYEGQNILLPPYPDEYDGILDHLEEDDVQIFTFFKGNNEDEVCR